MQTVDRLLAYVNSLHENLEFTIEREDDGSLPFLDLSITRHGRKISTSWYSKPTDTGLTLAFHSVAPTRYKQNIISGTIHRIHHATSNWEDFDKGVRKAIQDWESNQYPPGFYAPVLRKTVQTIVEGQTKTPTANIEEVKGEKPNFCLQYRGKASDSFARRLRSFNVSTIFTTRKLRSCLPSLKSDFPKVLRSGVVYQIDCPGCSACYVGQTVRHLTTRVTEHMRKTSPVGQHIAECMGSLTGVTLEPKILDTCRDASKLLTLEALHIAKKQPGLNQREEYRQRFLTLRL